ncbi:ATP-binding protein [Candidatus Nitrosopumilus sp. SW]|uniref:AAA family ATPase n=1 Tax=Candidatus Nitrosopumilus sp. SW TaxID=2508726 RepID=UPI0011504D5D|nr:ATP-binding protein [Candidatus Nitrosopumilus sp. SW]
MIGITLSGKTTFVKANFNHEEIRLYYFDNNRKKEMNYIEQCLKQGKSIVVDDTNLTKNIRKRHIDMAKKYNAKMIGIFMNTSSGIIEQRRTRRRDSFPLVAINKQLKEFETPNKDEGFDTLIIHKNYESANRS